MAVSPPGLASSTDIEIGPVDWFCTARIRWCDAWCGVLLQNFSRTVFDKSRKFDTPIIRDLNVWRCPSNAHCRDGRIDLHAACLCNLARDKRERPFCQAKQA